MMTPKTMRLSLKSALLAPVALTALSVAPHARADSIDVFTESKLVDGAYAKSEQFSTSSAGTMTVTLQNTGWASPLTALSFSANSATQVLASFSAVGLTSDTAQFQINSAGTYFASIMATAGGDMGLGLFSFKMTFSPTSPVPLPSTGWLLLTGLFALIGLARVARPVETLGTAVA
jgi:hypothetical protein